MARTIAEMIAPQISEADATMVDVFGLKSKPADDYFEQLSSIVGSIQQPPFYQTKEGMQTILDLVIGSPGSAIGRVSKAAITGGQTLTSSVTSGKSTMQQLQDIAKKFGIKEHPSKWEWSQKMIDDFVLGTKESNKINAARLKAEKIFDRSNIPHEAEMVDPVTMLLDVLKRN